MHNTTHGQGGDSDNKGCGDSDNKGWRLQRIEGRGNFVFYTSYMGAKQTMWITIIKEKK